jgi:lipopolysaccharide/colanic/teichoic acid biosynthesis glycosyltransferase
MASDIGTIDGGPLPVLLAGDGEVVAGLAGALRAGGGAFSLAGILEDGARPGQRRFGAPALGGLEDLPAAVARLAMHGTPVGLVVLAEPADAAARLRAAAAALGIPVVGAADFLRLRAARPAPPAAAPARPPFSGKRLSDLLAAAMLLLLTLPATLLVAGLLAACHGRPVLFGQLRPGYGGRPIRVLKFRTMRFALTPAGELAPDEERLTVLGRILRRTRLDELPQLWNVLRGDMSLIGPRPLLWKDLPDLPALLAERFSLRPGITGLAQVSGGDRLSPEEKLALDLWYARHRCARLDLQIALLTLWAMVAGDRGRFEGERLGPARP